VQKETILARFAEHVYQSKFYAMPSIAFYEPPLAGEDAERQIGFIVHTVEWVIDQFDAAFFQ
jgi:hypothetical protein